MRILVLTPTFLPVVGGAELFIFQVYRRLAPKHKILILTPHLPEKIKKNSVSSEYDDFINFKIEHYYDKFTAMKIRGHRITFGLIPPFSLSTVFAFKKAIAAFKPDVTNVHYVMPTGLAGIYAQKIAKIPTVITYNGRDVPGPGVPRLWKYWHRLISGNCEDIIFISQYCRDVIFGLKSECGHLVYGGVDKAINVTEKQKDALRSQLGLNKNENIIFAVQRLDYLKRTETIIESMPKILELKPNTKLIIGGTGSDMPRLKKKMRELGLSHSIIFTGYIKSAQLPVYFALADLFAFHSTYETFGIVLAEAMSYGKAIVSVNNTAIKEVVDNNKNGILVPTLSPADFADAVLQLLKDENLRIEMGNKGKMKAKNLFQWDLIASKYEGILKSAASNKNIIV